MRWPWVKSPENRGTLTFLPDGRLILGVPAGFDLRPEQAQQLMETLTKWHADPSKKSLILLFPVDVVDGR